MKTVDTDLSGALAIFLDHHPIGADRIHRHMIHVKYLTGLKRIDLACSRDEAIEIAEALSAKWNVPIGNR